MDFHVKACVLFCWCSDFLIYYWCDNGFLMHIFIYWYATCCYLSFHLIFPSNGIIFHPWYKEEQVWSRSSKGKWKGRAKILGAKIRKLEFEMKRDNWNLGSQISKDRSQKWKGRAEILKLEAKIKRESQNFETRYRKVGHIGTWYQQGMGKVQYRNPISEGWSYPNPISAKDGVGGISEPDIRRGLSEQENIRRFEHKTPNFKRSNLGAG